jgi:acid phosphatase type 7
VSASRGTLAFLPVLGVCACAWFRSPRPPTPGDLTRTDTLQLADSTVPVRGVLVGAGDIAWCSTSADDSTGKLVKDIVGVYQQRRIPVIVFTAGDNAYPRGTRFDYRNCYDPAWGRQLKGITRPAPGNHEYQSRGAAGYYDYFGEAAGAPGKGFYWFDLAGWDVYSLNSEVHQPASGATRRLYRRVAAEQTAWLAEQLKAPVSDCSIAYWHHPRWNSGPYGNNRHVDTLWRLLHTGGAEIVVTGHEHLYERFKPLGLDGTVDEEHGITEFVVGTGGADVRHFKVGRNTGVTEKQVEWKYGVLVLELEADRAHWRFIATTGETLDDGTVECHGRPLTSP